jgi:hypothetical protein
MLDVAGDGYGSTQVLRTREPEFGTRARLRGMNIRLCQFLCAASSTLYA